eukprot:Blabericola_migrator_1__1362@NODE_1353_length_4737_cov_37_807923_g908_i0_p3_GENE_NODE_1353_length_4737_cov_37_807923_g908_i0NODE_1353_length_4737_cov_37_807923_g908_i0_p3_ORF_typecomplete_len138_score10_84DUF1751/PF08551_10/0_031_NODE_1353_length_4737_cov_37_807923_g908_i06311044
MMPNKPSWRYQAVQAGFTISIQTSSNMVSLATAGRPLAKLWSSWSAASFILVMKLLTRLAASSSVICLLRRFSLADSMMRSNSDCSRTSFSPFLELDFLVFFPLVLSLSRFSVYVLFGVLVTGTSRSTICARLVPVS